MITTIHARPQLHAALRGIASRKPVLCPRCGKPLGAASGLRETQQMLGTHRCAFSASDMLQPSIAVPFS